MTETWNRKKLFRETLFLSICSVGLQGLGLLLIYRIITLAATFVYVSMSIRRLHDVNKSPLFLLLWLTGIGGIVPIIFCAQPSHPETNEFGPVPTSVV